MCQHLKVLKDQLSLFSPSQQTHSESQRSTVPQTWLPMMTTFCLLLPVLTIQVAQLLIRHTSVIWLYNIFLVLLSAPQYMVCVFWWRWQYVTLRHKGNQISNILSRVVFSIRDWVTSLVLNKKAVGWRLWSWVRRSHNVPQARNHIEGFEGSDNLYSDNNDLTQQSSIIHHFWLFMSQCFTTSISALEENSVKSQHSVISLCVRVWKKSTASTLLVQKLVGSWRRLWLGILAHWVLGIMPNESAGRMGLPLVQQGPRHAALGSIMKCTVAMGPPLGLMVSIFRILFTATPQLLKKKHRK